MTDIAINRDNLFSLLKDLIRINSVNPRLSDNGLGEGEIARFIRDYLNRLGLDVDYQEIEKNRPNVTGVLKGNGNGPTMMLNAHTDTVGVENMVNHPFDPVFKDGNIYGRGALDMKSGLAAEIMAIQSILEAGIHIEGDIILTCIIDEEYESIGTEAMLKNYTADAAIICEPTNVSIITAHKGFAWERIEVFGKAAHGSLPDQGIDAIAKAGKVLCGIEKLSQDLQQKEAHALLGKPSIHTSLINGGSGISTYPDKCKIELERRTLPGEDRAFIEGEIKALLDDIRSKDEKFKANLDVYLVRPSYEISPDQPIIQSLTRAYQSVRRKVPRYKGMGAWLESALLAEAGIPSVIFGPYGQGAHAEIEFVDFESVVTTTDILIRTILDFCGNASIDC